MDTVEEVDVDATLGEKEMGQRGAELVELERKELEMAETNVNTGLEMIDEASRCLWAVSMKPRMVLV